MALTSYAGRGGLLAIAPGCALLVMLIGLLAGCDVSEGGPRAGAGQGAGSGAAGQGAGGGSTVVTEAPGEASAFPAGQVPQFSGPWAGEFTETYSRSSTDFERAVLSDGVITDQELAETQDRFRQCLADLGFAKIVLNPDSGFSFDAPDGAAQKTVEDQVKKCSHDFGQDTVVALYAEIRRNPENRDENAIMAACLVRKGVVDPSYGARDYAGDVAGYSFPFLSGVSPSQADLAFDQCNNDPLGLSE